MRNGCFIYSSHSVCSGSLDHFYRNAGFERSGVLTAVLMKIRSPGKLNLSTGEDLLTFRRRVLPHLQGYHPKKSVFPRGKAILCKANHLNTVPSLMCGISPPFPYTPICSSINSGSCCIIFFQVKNKFL